MFGYPLDSVLLLRRRQEESARRTLSEATRAVMAAEREETARRAAVVNGRARWESAAARIGGGTDGESPTTSAELGVRARFVERMRKEWKQAERSLAAFRSGPLASVRVAEQAERARHLAARQALRVLERHEAMFSAARLRGTALREDETLEEAARAARHGRPLAGGRP